MERNDSLKGLYVCVVRGSFCRTRSVSSVGLRYSLVLRRTTTERPETTVDVFEAR
jgi:hypothetical protein